MRDDRERGGGTPAQVASSLQERIERSGMGSQTNLERKQAHKPSFQLRLFETTTHRPTGVKCRASVAKNCVRSTEHMYIEYLKLF